MGKEPSVFLSAATDVQLQCRHLLPGGELICFIVPRAFSAVACEQLLTEEVKADFQSAHTHYPTYYRNNDRLVVDSETLSEQLFQTIAAVLPAQLPADEAGGLPWHLRQLNTRLRFCRYSAGQYFHRHLDGVYHQSAKVQSRLTFMIYLNDAAEFSGGRTLFYRSKDDEAIWAAYTPAQGDLLVFDHRIWHEGEELEEGEKFVLRSDILYEREQPLPIAASSVPFAAGHLGYIWQVIPFGENVVSAGRDTTIKVWNKEGACIQQLHGHRNSILSLCQLNATTLLSGARDMTIRVWKWEHGQFQPAQSLHPHAATILSVARLTDTLFCSSAADGLIKVSDLTGTVRQTLAGHSDWVWQVVPLYDDELVSASEDGTLKRWNWRQGTCVGTIAFGLSPVHVLLPDPAQSRLICGNQAGELQVWQCSPDRQRWQLAYNVLAHRGVVRTLAWLADGQLASGGEDNKVKIWNLDTWHCAQEMTHADFVQSVAWLPMRRQLISASYDGTLKVWPLNT